jgi:uncharacterized protein YecT (DUF1311 family)
VLFGLVLTAIAAQAEDKVDCTDPLTQMDMTICADQAFRSADAALNEAYQAAVTAMEQIDSYSDETSDGAVAALRDAQRAWIDFRDKACVSAGYVVHGGSMEPMIVAQCRTRLTDQRTAGLKELAEGEGN